MKVIHDAEYPRLCLYIIRNRGGTRGGQAEFTWDQVRADHHRENYLGHSIFAPTGRWQNHKDVNWYNKDTGNDESAQQASKDAAVEKRRQELMNIKMREEEEMNRRLGIKPGQQASGSRSSSSSRVGDTLLRGSNYDVASSRAAATTSTGSNRAPLDVSKSRWNLKPTTIDDQNKKELQELESGLSKEDRKAAKHLAKMQVREERRLKRESRHQKRRHSSHSSDEEKSRRDYSRNAEDRERRPERDGYRDVRHETDRERDRRHSNQRRESSPRRRLDDSTNHHHHHHHREDSGRQHRSRSPGRSMTPEMQRRRRG